MKMDKTLKQEQDAFLRDTLYKTDLYALDERPAVFRGKNKTRLKRTGKKVENGQD